VSRGTTADIDPAAWTIENGKLYLNLSKPIRSTWQKDMRANIKKGDSNWPKLLHR